QLAALDQIVKNLDAFTSPVEQLRPVVAAIEDTAKKSQRLHTPLAFELILARDEIVAKTPGLQSSEGALTLAQLLREEDRRLHEILPAIPAAKQKRVLIEFPQAFGDE